MPNLDRPDARLSGDAKVDNDRTLIQKWKFGVRRIHNPLIPLIVIRHHDVDCALTRCLTPLIGFYQLSEPSLIGRPICTHAEANCRIDLSIWSTDQTTPTLTDFKERPQVGRQRVPNIVRELTSLMTMPVIRRGLITLQWSNREVIIADQSNRV